MALRRIISEKNLLRYNTRGSSFGNVRGLQTLSLPDIPYGYGASEPIISREIMELHHQKHHNTYVTNFNKALKQLDEAMNNGDSPTIVELQSSIKFNGGGHINHSIFWKNLAPLSEGGGEPPQGVLGDDIQAQFGSLEKLIEKMNAEGTALQGSGWAWLALDTKLRRLLIETTMNQDPLVTKGSALVPLVGVDVWEHAYYLQYKNVKADYLRNIWRVVKWNYASEVYKNVGSSGKEG